MVLIVVAVVFRYPNPGSLPLSKPKKMDAVSQISWEQPSVFEMLCADDTLLWETLTNSKTRLQKTYSTV